MGNNHEINKNKKMRKCEVTECLVTRGCYKESYLEKITKVKKNIFNLLQKRVLWGFDSAIDGKLKNI